MDLPLSFHHVGFVVADIAASVEKFACSMGANWDGCVYEDPHQKVRVTFMSTQCGGPRIELVEPAGDDSPVLRFLREKGGGLHHVCYEVGDVKRGMAEMKARGAYDRTASETGGGISGEANRVDADG